MKPSKTLTQAWNKRRELRKEGIKLKAKGYKLTAESYKLWAKGYKLRAEGDKLWAEGYKLIAKADLIFLDAVIKEKGDIAIDWENYNAEKKDSECHLKTGEVFKP